MSARPKGRSDRRVLAMGALIVVALVLLARVLPSLRAWQSDARDSARRLGGELARARATVAHAQLTRDSLAARQARFIALAPLLIRGETPAMGSAVLASLISTAASAASVRLGPVQVHADTGSRGAFSRVGVRAEVTGDIRGIGTFMAFLERGPTLIAVRELTIAQLEPAAAPDRAEVLHVTLAADALMLTPRPTRPSGHPATGTARRAR